MPIIPRRQDKPPCRPCGGNPIYPLTASKRQQEFLGHWLGSQGYAVFDSRRKVIAPSAGELPWKAAPSFGGLWESSIHKKLVVQTADDQSVKGIQASRGDHVWVSFGKPGLGLVADADVMDRIVGVASGWRYTDANAMALEDYDANGTLGKVSYRDGRFLAYQYSDVNTPVEVAPLPGLLIQLQDQTGRTVKFKYEAAEAGPRVKSITGPDGLDTQLEYNGNGNLLRVTWPDGKSRQYLYELGPIPGFVWTKIADADGPVTVTETVKVRYGKGTDWLERTVPGQGLCEPGFFGGDPAVGVPKQCDRLDVLAGC